MELAYTNRTRLENDMEESLMFLANEVTVPHFSFDSTVYIIYSWDKLVGEIRLGFR
jgi:hypothetical protein